MLISLESQNWDDFDPSTLPPLPEAHERRLQAVSALLKERCSSNPFHARRATLEGEVYWPNLACSMPNPPGVDLPYV